MFFASQYDTIVCRVRDAVLGYVPGWITPNGLTLVRLVLVLPLMTTLALGMRGAATIIFMIGAATDALDGPLARVRRIAGVGFGKILDPITDKFFFLAPLLWIVASGEYRSFMLAPFIALEASIAGLGIAEFIRAEWRPWACTGANVFGKLKTGCEGVCIWALLIAPSIAVPTWAPDALLAFACIFGLANVAARWMQIRAFRMAEHTCSGGGSR
ncbi:CDP-alcohol phosphatidyltransferase family protein [Candidatus Uhrbacteria bacterium]|nr:CDP-alcohol phosphatidyltransferase family protein [Candidatus Uhrbacteria bacterium]